MGFHGDGPVAGHAAPLVEDSARPYPVHAPGVSSILGAPTASPGGGSSATDIKAGDLISLVEGVA